MALLALSDERIAREVARCEAGERRHRAEARRLLYVAGLMLAGNLLQVVFWGFALHLTGERAQQMAVAASLSALLPTLIIVIAQLRRGD